jgi:O-antigen ligase
LIANRLNRVRPNQLAWFIIAGVLFAAVAVGQRASVRYLGLLLLAYGGVALALRPALGLPVLIGAALLVPIGLKTGTDVELNLVSLLLPAITGLWIVQMIRKGHIALPPARANRPLLLFLGMGLVSLLIGLATWDPMVPRSERFILVQLAQWAIFAFSAFAFWLTAALVPDERRLHQLTLLFLGLAGVVAIAASLLGVNYLVQERDLITLAFIRAPFWILLMGLALGQLLFNPRLAVPWRILLVAVIAASLYYAFGEQRETASIWLGLAVAGAVIAWFRFPKLRWPVALVTVVLLAVGVLGPFFYSFAGGDKEWTESGGSRLALAQRVIEVTMRNPITGLGPAAYRPYTSMRPLRYGNAYWLEPRISAHNNYVDLFAHTGIIGLGLFIWFMVEAGLLAWRAYKRAQTGFARGFAISMLAVLVAIAVVMALADWFLPFVYNIGFAGFQASVLVWLFLGGLVVLADVPPPADAGQRASQQ